MEETASPCTKICAVDPQSGLCIGCLRTLAEIMSWPDYTEQEKRTVLENIEQRKMTAPAS